MASEGSLILTTLQTRLQSITVSSGYPLTVKTVALNTGNILIDIASTKLPYIEIINGDEKILERYPGGMVRGSQTITLRIVKTKSATDGDMEDFKSAVIRCLFGNTYNPAASNPSACRLNNGTRDLITLIEYVSTFTDFNMINSNRIWDVNFNLIYNRKITAF